MAVGMSLVLAVARRRQKKERTVKKPQRAARLAKAQ
jgi:hypothetical protein